VAVQGNSIVVYDACVLFPALLRNLLLQLATTGLFRARWTDTIHREWMGRLRSARPDIPHEQIERIRHLIDLAVPDCIVTGHERLIDGLCLPDRNDRHVLAAAIRCDAQLIVTANCQDFPDSALLPHGVHAEHPDKFIARMITDSPDQVCDAIATLRARLRNPPLSAHALVNRIRDVGLPGTAARLESLERIL
jgi:hypothetical protein